MTTTATLTMFIRDNPTPRPGDTVEIYLVTRDELGALVAHSAPAVVLYDPNGATASVGSSVSVGTGITIIPFPSSTTTSTEGTYRAAGSVSVTLGSHTRSKAAETTFVIRRRKP